MDPWITERRLHFRVEGFQFAAGVGDFHLPIDAALGVDVVRPGCDFRLEFGESAEASAGDALSRERTQFVLGDVQPAAVLGREEQRGT